MTPKEFAKFRRLALLLDEVPFDASEIRVVRGLGSWAAPLELPTLQSISRQFHTLSPIWESQQEQSRAPAVKAYLSQDIGVPALLEAELSRLRDNLQATLFSQGCPQNLEFSGPGYLFVVEVPFEQMLNQYGVLGLPLSIFGRSSNRHCVLSSLLPRGSLLGTTKPVPCEAGGG